MHAGSGFAAQPVVLALTAATAVFIAIGSLWRGDSPLIRMLPHWFAPLWHFVVYVLLAFLVSTALAPIVAAPAARAASGFLLATAVGALMEYLQTFRVGRYPRVGDVLIDAAGAALGTWLALSY